MYRLTRTYRLCSVRPKKWTYRIRGLFPRFSFSPAFISLSDDEGNIVRHDAQAGFDAGRTMDEIDKSLDVPLDAGSYVLTLEVQVPDDASSAAGFARFTLEGNEVRRLDHDFWQFQLQCHQTDLPPRDRLTVNNWTFFSREAIILSAKIVQACYNDMPRAVALAESLGFAGDTVVSLPTDGRAGSGVVVLRSGHIVFVWIAGTTTNAQLVQQGAEMLLGPRDLGNFGSMLLHVEGAQRVLALMAQTGYPDDSKVVLCGHSMGGAIASIIAVMLKAHAKERDVQVITFGMPKPGDQRFRDFLGTCPGIHICNDGDVIPQTCPERTEIPTTAALIPEATLRVTDLWRFPRYQVVLTQDGALRFGKGRPLSDNLDGVVLDWLAGEPIDAAVAHTMDEYIRRLELRPRDGFGQ